MKAVSEVFAAQDALATHRQLEDVGVTRSLRRQRLESGEWERISDTVVGISGAPVTWRRQVRAAWLDAGDDTAVSHCTAARMFAFDGFEREAGLHVTVCGGRHRTTLPGVRLHRSELLDEASRIWIDGIAVVSKPIALLQVASTHPADSVARALDGLMRDGASPQWIEQVVTSWRRRGVRGPSTVLSLLHDRVGGELPRSWFQRLAKRVLASHNVRMVDEHPVRDPVTGKKLAELDLAIPDFRIGVECQSWEWHSSPGARARDAARKRRLRLLGWELVELWWTDLYRIDGVLSEVQYLIDQRRP
jgi:hypothetical protein